MKSKTTRAKREPAPRFVPIAFLAARLGCTPEAVLRRVNSPGSPGRTACGAYDLQAWLRFSHRWRGKGSRALLQQAAPFDRGAVLGRVRELISQAEELLTGGHGR